jgi:hypothetical protein
MAATSRKITRNRAQRTVSRAERGSENLFDQLNDDLLLDLFCQLTPGECWMFSQVNKRMHAIFRGNFVVIAHKIGLFSCQAFDAIARDAVDCQSRALIALAFQLYKKRKTAPAILDGEGFLDYTERLFYSRYDSSNPHHAGIFPVHYKCECETRKEMIKEELANLGVLDKDYYMSNIASTQIHGMNFVKRVCLCDEAFEQIDIDSNGECHRSVFAIYLALYMRLRIPIFLYRAMHILEFLEAYPTADNNTIGASRGRLIGIPLRYIKFRPSLPFFALCSESAYVAILYKDQLLLKRILRGIGGGNAQFDMERLVALALSVHKKSIPILIECFGWNTTAASTNEIIREGSISLWHLVFCIIARGGTPKLKALYHFCDKDASEKLTIIREFSHRDKKSTSLDDIVDACARCGENAAWFANAVLCALAYRGKLANIKKIIEGQRGGTICQFDYPRILYWATYDEPHTMIVRFIRHYLQEVPLDEEAAALSYFK